MVLGSGVLSLALVGLIVPNHLADAGLTGIAILIHYLSGLPVGPVFGALNIPLLAWAWGSQGRRFMWRTAVGVALVSAWTTLLAPYPLPVHDAMLAAIYGGLGVGIGLGLLLRSGSSSGGSDIVARHGHRRYGWSFSQAYLVMDLIVLVCVAIWVGLPAAMYAWIATMVAGQVVNYVVEGPRRARLALLISNQEEQIRPRITAELGRGATRLEGIGAYTGANRPVLMTAVSSQELIRLRQLVLREDPQAFLIVLPAAEVVGEGFWQGGTDEV